jgi:type IV secretory pathway VirJ component
MFTQTAFDPWQQTIMTHLPRLSKSQARVLAWWSLGMVLARSCALSAVSAFLAEVLNRRENTVRQRLREWCYEAHAKRGAKRQEIRIETCFSP